MRNWVQTAASHVANFWRDQVATHEGNALRLRVERFGAIIHSLAPRALVFIDREAATPLLRNAALRATANALWTTAAADGNITAQPLTAPLEAHLQLTNHCDQHCVGCYTGASAAVRPDTEWGLAQWQRALDELRAAGVFHVALGGGESATLPWLGALVDYAWQLGIVPNLTTSGLSNLPRLLAIAHRFGQINVSLDGLGATYQAVRGFDGFDRADHAIRKLRAVNSRVGVNVVVTRQNFDQLDDIFAYAKRRRLSEVELLRFKPAGRGAKAYQDLRCSDAQHLALLPAILRSAKRHRIRVKVDCSYTPMLAAHQPGRDVLAQLGVYGCTAGDFLVGAKSQGQLTACSFAPAEATAAQAARPTVDKLRDYWAQTAAFATFRQWRNAEAPCRACSYLDVCRGGCRVVAMHAGTPHSPDPECPAVLDFRRAQKPVVRLPVI